MTQDQSSLDPEETALGTVMSYFLTETQARNFLAFYLFTGDEPLKPNALLSYGQRARLMLAVMVAQGCNCLLLTSRSITWTSPAGPSSSKPWPSLTRGIGSRTRPLFHRALCRPGLASYR